MIHRQKSINLKKNQNKLLVIHYASSSIDDIYPSISSIAAYDSKVHTVKVFSRTNLTLENEIFLLESFVKFVQVKISEGFYLVGWNWGKQYGIQPLINRYIQLTGKKPKLSILKIEYFDFLKILSSEFNEFFGGFKLLAKFNGLEVADFTEGLKEIELFQRKQFVMLDQSTTTKVELIHKLLLKYLNDEILVPTLEEMFYAYSDTGSYPIFKENIEKIEQLINVKNVNVASEDLQAILRNLLYGSVITCLETYLSDTFIRITLQDKKFLKKYILESAKFAEKSKRSELYSELFEETTHSVNQTIDRFLAKKCIEDIKEITFHNITTASTLYKHVLNIEFPAKVLPEIRKAVLIRHDLIHRNGKNRADERVTIALEQLRKLIKNVTTFVKSIHQAAKILRKE